jgi:hypothetical protein
VPAARRVTAPVATGLSERPTRASRGASIASLAQPTANWLAAIVAVTPTAANGRTPAPIESSAATTVTAAPGSGWLA